MDMMLKDVVVVVNDVSEQQFDLWWDENSTHIRRSLMGIKNGKSYYKVYMKSNEAILFHMVEDLTNKVF